MTRTSRATNVQVPGAQPPADQPGNDQANATATGATHASGASSSGEKPETTELANTAPGAADVFDIDALRAQIRLEEQARARAELASQTQAASAVVGATDVAAPATAPRSRADYKAMRADQVDPATLTAPVMTRDGWVCPVPPEKK